VLNQFETYVRLYDKIPDELYVSIRNYEDPVQITNAISHYANFKTRDKQHFSNTDPRWKDCDSFVFLKEAARLAEEKGYLVGNIDAFIMAERPKMAGYIPQMRERIAAALGIDVNQVGVKAGTMERMGFVGREEGIECQAIACLIRKK